MPVVGLQSRDMLVFALISLALSLPQDVYAPPAVRPYEPPSNFGRIVEEGDGEGDRRRRPIVAPVAVEAYRGSYEHRPSGADTAYDQGVAGAEAAMDARMGPLDGLWKVIDADGRMLFSLALTDAGPNRPLEGAYREADATAALGPITETERTAGRVVMAFAGVRLTLRASTAGWAGRLSEGGRERPVTLTR